MDHHNGGSSLWTYVMRCDQVERLEAENKRLKKAIEELYGRIDSLGEDRLDAQNEVNKREHQIAELTQDLKTANDGWSDQCGLNETLMDKIDVYRKKVEIHVAEIEDWKDDACIRIDKESR